ncbi:MAG: hypothetical protein MUC93_05335 [Bacteroidales bacterium]|jgi:hypothetical protein|nr:hypothetical protein [Bacteroidales bacterium]
MKQKIYILGLATTGILFAGTLFKVQHWPGAGYLLTIGILMLVLIFLPVALRNHYKTEGNNQNSLLYLVTWLTCLVVFIAMLFKIMHWPGAGYALIIALPFPYIVFLPVFLAVTSKNKSFNIYNTVYVLFLLTAFSAVSVLLALNVSKEMTVDSLKISDNYNRLEAVLDEIQVINQQSPVIQKIDDVLKTVNEYQDMIFRHEGITEAQWNANPEILIMSGSRQVVPASMLTGKEGLIDTKLETGLSDLVLLLGRTPGYEKLSASAPVIFDLRYLPDNRYIWTDRLFKNIVQPWALTYLDGLETNLKMIKALVY